jgi:hypothetical protein
MHKLSAPLFMKLAIVIVVAVLVHGPSAYACTIQGCIPQGQCEALVKDFSFLQGCTAWKAVNGATKTTSGGGYALLNPTTGAVYQDIVVPTGYDFAEMSIFLGGVTGTPGTEFYRVVITTPQSSLLEYVDVFWPGDNPSGRYDYSVGYYAGQTIRVRVSRIQGTAPGDTVLKVDALEMWALYNY